MSGKEKGKLVKQHNGYVVLIGADGKAKRKKVDLLVAATFLPVPPPEKNVLVHLNGKKSDNSADNLKWMTRREATEHKNKIKC
jgi:hypothetical protein